MTQLFLGSFQSELFILSQLQDFAEFIGLSLVKYQSIALFSSLYIEFGCIIPQMRNIDLVPISQFLEGKKQFSFHEVKIKKAPWITKGLFLIIQST